MTDVSSDMWLSMRFRFWPILLSKSGGNRLRSSVIVGALGEARCAALLGGLDVQHRYQFRGIWRSTDLKLL
jgi:hypothetical protein